MVAVDDSSVAVAPRDPSRGGDGRWTIATASIVGVGIALRLLLVPPSDGGVPAAVMLILLSAGVWSVGWALGSVRIGTAAVLVVVALVVLAALPPRAEPEYDERFAFFRTDQPIEATVSAAVQPRTPVLALLVEPVSASSQARIGLAGSLGGTELQWQCPFQPGLQRLGLPLPPQSVPAGRELDVRLHLTGMPSREADYLLVYSAAGRYLVSLMDAEQLEQSATRCTLR